MTKQKIGIVVPFFNGHKYLDKLIESFDLAGEGHSCALYIIDNSPAESQVDIKYKARMPVEVIRERPAIGYGKANNKGFQICADLGYDFVIIANQDAYVSRNFIHDLLSPFGQDPEILISAPLLRTYEGNAIEDFFVRYYLSQIPELISDLISGIPKEYYEVEKFSGACFAFRLRSKRYTYKYLFDSIFHMYMEDEDLCLRIRRLHLKIVLCIKPVFYHQHSHTTDVENKDEIAMDKLTSEYIFRLKNGGKGIYKLLYGVIVTAASQVTYHVLRGEFGKTYKQMRSLGIAVKKFPAILRSRRADSGRILAN